MKALYALISIMLLSLTYSDDTKTCTFGMTASKNKDCNDLTFPENSQFKYCCFYHYKMTLNSKEEDFKTCFPMSKETYDSIDKYFDTLKTQNANNAGFNIESLDCNSYYLHATILSLLLILI